MLQASCQMLACCSLGALLALGGCQDRDPAPAPTSEEEPSLGDLLGGPLPPAAGPTSAEQPPAMTVQPAVPDPAAQAPGPEIQPAALDAAAVASGTEGTAADEEPSGATPECVEARQRLKDAREGVDRQRAREVQAAERELTQAQAALYECRSARHPCGEGKWEAAVKVRERSDRAEDRYQAVLRKVGELEASLFTYEQAVDAACGRR